MKFPIENRNLRSELTREGAIELSLVREKISAPEDSEIVLRMDAAPINPTDLNLLLAGSDLVDVQVHGEGDSKRLILPLSEAAASANYRRLGRSLAPGLEGAGVVVAAGPGASQYLGMTAAVFGGAAYGEYRKARPMDCIFFEAGFPARKAAASFVNPMTALSMVHNMRRDAHSAIIHTAAASSLGRMLERLCADEGIPLINVLRSARSRDALLAEGVRYALDSSSPDFHGDLAAFVRETDATLAFDAVGGGPLAGRILAAMEEVFAPPPEAYDIYGSRRLKQVYVYGGLNPGPIEIQRGFGSAWSVSGWLMMNYLAKLSEEEVAAMKARITREIETIFRTEFAEEIALDDMLDPQRLRALKRMATGRKVLVRLNR